MAKIRNLLYMIQILYRLGLYISCSDTEFNFWNKAQLFPNFLKKIIQIILSSHIVPEMMLITEKGNAKQLNMK